jgi:hypothetical protein
MYRLIDFAKPLLRSWRSGREIQALYKRFLEGGEDIFSRSAGGGRVVETAGYWLQGFKGDAFKRKDPKTLPQPDVIIPEATVRRSSSLSKRANADVV